MGNKIKIKFIGITKLHVDAIVNAANSSLLAGGGVCGAIFSEAGYKELTEACNKIGYCKTGSAVITPGFNLPSKYIIHAVGPIWNGGKYNEAELLYNAYRSSLLVAKENNCHSIAFPLISAGIYLYPLEDAWEIAIKSCLDFLKDNEDYDIDITFAVINQSILVAGEKILKELTERN